MTSSAASGTTLYYKPSSSWVSIGGIHSVSHSFKSDTIETTNLSSTHRSYIKGIADLGEVSFDIDFDGDDTALVALRTACIAASGTAAANYKILFSDASMIIFNGIVTDFKEEAKENEVLSCSVTIKIASTVTFSEA